MIDRTCQVCHRESEETLRNNVYERQRKANEIRNRLEQELAKAHIEAKFAWDKGATETQMKDVLALIRQAQWRWDFGVASHGGSFHAPQEIQRLSSSMGWIEPCRRVGYLQGAGEAWIYRQCSYAGYLHQRQGAGIYRARYGCRKSCKGQFPEDYSTGLAGKSES